MRGLVRVVPAASYRAVFHDLFNRARREAKRVNPELTRRLWDTDDYADNVLLTKDMLPISKSYALSLIDAFLVHHVLGLATQADKMANSKDLVSS